ncbi:NADH dehydrogenase subunit 5 (mitochondrion) [Nannochloropsis gaditana]|uniref:NADH-ubiquinone oxidoreductase chain 5 n=1 Tax=Nannochloropsis gaditana TaxID=72520 RepID=K9ZXT2_9STRA|nr:NADH dehydrogenase subunit 5 [Nannochloropsis gaditana]AFZ64331.1 NADH dehydrogenase subunit 5 [Nannochloropsis gaditana]AGI49052.1 NADH dehydrogenase subunit 5 [Nannochloropsis gaditana]AHX24907.1 NADH dehydrogenase subunit 5 [Nannochloropsis gaditana]
MYLTLVFLPLFGSIAAGFFGFFIGSQGAGFITILCLGLTFLMSCFAFYEVAFAGSPCFLQIMPWFDSELFSFAWGFQFDSLTAVMLIVVTFISFLVHLYSTEYMSHDPHLPRFMSYLSLFTFFMLILVTADNFIQMFVGWEGVGLCSYLLINFWFTRIQANKAAIKAMFMNRIGDFGLALGIFCIFVTFGAVDYSTIFTLAPYFLSDTINFLNIDFNLLDLVGILLFIGAVGKSAQLGLHTWLPDAMEGPTPVSALIHAATMVTAGVFLIARCSPLYEYAPGALSVITIVGAMTAFFAASTGLLQNDMKKVIAYSTCSQLGYMIFACGLSNYHVGVFHLANHAFFKALLFLGAGCVIHAVGDEQDMRKLGGLSKIMPFTYGMMLIGSFSLMGFPFLTGFYSKDVILEVAYGKYSTSGHFAYVLGSLSAFLTAFYSVRLLYLTFLSKPNGYRVLILNAHEAPWRMALPLLILVIPSIFIGYLTKDMIIGLGTNFWQGSIYIQPKNFNIIDAEHIPQAAKLLPVCLSILGALTSFILYFYGSQSLFLFKTSPLGLKFYTFLNRKWFFDKIYNEIIGQFFLSAAYNLTYKQIDRGLIESLGPFGLTRLVSKIALSLKVLQTGFFYHYTLAMVFSLISFLAYFRFENSTFILLSDSKLWFLFVIALFFINTDFKSFKN